MNKKFDAHVTYTKSVELNLIPKNTLHLYTIFEFNIFLEKIIYQFWTVIINSGLTFRVLSKF